MPKRLYDGRTHVVTVTDEGFEYAGRSYASLTKVAFATRSRGSRMSVPPM